MTIVYLVRHGETLWNTLKKIQGWSDSPLTDKGIYQAGLLSKRLKSTHIDVIYSSSAGRAFKTAEIIKGSRDINIIPRDNLREINLGLWEGKEQDFLRKEYGEQYMNFWTKPDLYKPMNGESFLDTQNRLVNELKKIVLENEGKTILIVAHTVAIKVIMSYYENRPISRLWEDPYINHTSLSRLDFNDEKVDIIMYGDDLHLKESEINKIV